MGERGPRESSAERCTEGRKTSSEASAVCVRVKFIGDAARWTDVALYPAVVWSESKIAILRGRLARRTTSTSGSSNDSNTGVSSSKLYERASIGSCASSCSATRAWCTASK